VPIMVEYEESCVPPDVRIRIVCGQVLTADQGERLDKLIDAWYWIGSYGGFGGFMHFADESLHQVEDGRTTVEWLMDLGSAGDNVLEVLRRSLEGFMATEGVRIDRLVFA
jgi:hypothetical protein